MRSLDATFDELRQRLHSGQRGSARADLRLYRILSRAARQAQRSIRRMSLRIAAGVTGPPRKSAMTSREGRSRPNR